MKEKTCNVLRHAKNGAGKALMALSLMGMVSMSVSAAGGRELSDINNDVNVSHYGLNLNANGRIEYDKNLDGNYQKLAESIRTVDRNEQELDKEYNRLYNLAEQNRKDLIKSWNRFGVLTLADNAAYVTGTGTASIKGAMDSMPIHKFSDITLSYSNGSVNVGYPNPAWGVYNGGTIDTAEIEKQINEALKHTEKYTFREDERSHDFGETHKVREVDAGPAIDKARKDGHDQGVLEGIAAGGNTVYCGDHSLAGFGSKSKSIHLAKGIQYNLRVVFTGGGTQTVTLGDQLKLEADPGNKTWNITIGKKVKKAEKAFEYFGLTGGVSHGGSYGGLTVTITTKEDMDLTMSTWSGNNGVIMAVVE